MACGTDFIIAGLGFCPFLSPLECVHHAGISGTAVQPKLRHLPGHGFRDRLHLHQNLGPSLRRRRRARAGRRLESADGGADSGDRHRHLHGRRRARGGHLHRSGADDDSDRRRGDAHGDRPRSHRRVRRAACGRAGQLLPHDQTDFRSGLSLDRNIFWRAHSRNLVLVHGPGDRAARPLCERRRSRQGGRNFCRILKGAAGLYSGASWHDCFRLVPQPLPRSRRPCYERRHRLPGNGGSAFAHRLGRPDDCRAAGGSDGRDECRF